MTKFYRDFLVLSIQKVCAGKIEILEGSKKRTQKGLMWHGIVNIQSQ